MSRITFMASGVTWERVSEQMFTAWQTRCANYGYPCTLEIEDGEKCLLINDTEQPYFKPNKKALPEGSTTKTHIV